MNLLYSKPVFSRLVCMNSGFGADEPFLPLANHAINYTGPLCLKKGDVLVFEGGCDIDPSLYGETPGKWTQSPHISRDEVEIMAFQQARKMGIPMIGICRGAQLITALLGGKLVQHVDGHNHDHPILIENGERAIEASSVHHQMMWPEGIRDYELLAWTLGLAHKYLNGKNEDISAQLPHDGTDPTSPVIEPEIIHYPEVKALCIQGHPEYHLSTHVFPTYCRQLVSTLLTKH